MGRSTWCASRSSSSTTASSTATAPTTRRARGSVLGSRDAAAPRQVDRPMGHLPAARGITPSLLSSTRTTASSPTTSPPFRSQESDGGCVRGDYATAAVALSSTPAEQHSRIDLALPRAQGFPHEALQADSGSEQPLRARRHARRARRDARSASRAGQTLQLGAQPARPRALGARAAAGLAGEVARGRFRQAALVPCASFLRLSRRPRWTHALPRCGWGLVELPREVGYVL